MDIEIEEVIKVNGEHFHIDDIVKINLLNIEKDKVSIIGRISCISSNYVQLDYSEKYISSTMYIYFNNIKSIEKVKGE